MDFMEQIDIGWRTALLFSLSLPIFLSAIFVALKAVERPAGYFLSALLVTWAIHSIPYIIGFAGAYDAFPWLTFAPFNMELWFGPLLYLHVYFLVRKERLQHMWWWLLPGAVQFTYYLTCFVTLGAAERKFAYNDSFHEPFLVPIETITGLGLAIAGAYLAVRQLREYRQWLDKTSAAADEFDPVWLKRFVWTMALIVLLWVSFDIWDTISGGLSYIENYWMYVAIGAAVLWLGFDGLSHASTRFPKISALSQPLPQKTPAKLDVADIRKRILHAGWHRDEDLSISQLAQRLGTNETYLSQAINRGSGFNFNRFINEIRVKEVCDQLAKDDGSRSLLDIALGAGFASKATFNRVFKETTGMTPSQWRSKHATTSQSTENSREFGEMRRQPERLAALRYTSISHQPRGRPTCVFCFALLFLRCCLARRKHSPGPARALLLPKTTSSNRKQL